MRHRIARHQRRRCALHLGPCVSRRRSVQRPRFFCVIARRTHSRALLCPDHRATPRHNKTKRRAPGALHLTFFLVSFFGCSWREGFSPCPLFWLFLLAFLLLLGAMPGSRFRVLRRPEVWGSATPKIFRCVMRGGCVKDRAHPFLVLREYHAWRPRCVARVKASRTFIAHLCDRLHRYS